MNDAQQQEQPANSMVQIIKQFIEIDTQHNQTQDDDWYDTEVCKLQDTLSSYEKAILYDFQVAYWTRLIKEPTDADIQSWVLLHDKPTV